MTARVPVSHLRRIVAAAAMAHGVPLRDVLSPRRDAPIAHARQAAMLACREMTAASLPQIGAALGRDYSTVRHGIEAARARGADLAPIARLLASAEARP